MTRDNLLAALAVYAGDAQRVCLETLSDERSSMHLSNDVIHTTNLLTIYRRRAMHVKSIGLPTVGFDDAVRRLEDTPYERLRLASHEAPTGHPWCVLFVAPDAVEIVAALAVTGPMPTT
jgi:hypothetical protein